MEKKTAHLGFQAEPSLVQRIDEWRRQQPDLPPRSEAIRRLIEKGLDSTESK